jgi:hypothetical protein
MAFDWIAAGKVTLAAGEAFLSYLQDRKEDTERARDREMILAAINKMHEEVLDMLVELEVNELKGELEGFQLTYASYDPDPNDPIEESRLTQLIDDSARVLGRLGANLDTVSSNPKLALETWAVYVPLLYLRAQAMAERQTTFGKQETSEALLSFEMALPRLQGLLSYLRRESDSRFGGIVCKRVPDSQDRQVCWYYFAHKQYICGSLRDPKGLDKCQRARARHMDSAYRGYRGVREITAAADQLEHARDALETITIIDSLTKQGVPVGDLTFVNGRLERTAPKRSKVFAVGAVDGSASVPDWFA